MPAPESQLETPSTSRLVIRVKLIPQDELPPPARPRSSKSALIMILGAAAVMLSWLGLSILRSDPTPSPTARGAPLPRPATEPVKAVSVEPAMPQQPDPPPSPIDQVLPHVPQSALGTITGTVKVSVRVILDKQGAVAAAAADNRGPSRYFERLAVEAAKKWTFTPAQLEEKRTMLVKFNFTRHGATAHASPAH